MGRVPNQCDDAQSKYLCDKSSDIPFGGGVFKMADYVSAVYRW